MVLCVLLWIVTVYVSETTVGGFSPTQFKWTQVDQAQKGQEFHLRFEFSFSTGTWIRRLGVECVEIVRVNRTILKTPVA